ncbi:hypothetical protein GCM10009094_30900 [Massilia aurea]
MPNTIQASASGAAADGAAAPGVRRAAAIKRRISGFQLMLLRADKRADSSLKRLQAVIVAL